MHVETDSGIGGWQPIQMVHLTAQCVLGQRGIGGPSEGGLDMEGGEGYSDLVGYRVSKSTGVVEIQHSTATKRENPAVALEYRHESGSTCHSGDPSAEAFEK